MPVEVKGIVEAQKALKQFAPDLFKEMNKEIRNAMRVVVKDAQSQVPSSIQGLSGWQDQGKVVVSRTAGKTRGFPKYNGLVIRKGLGYSLGRSRRNSAGFVNIYKLFNRSAAGAIYETAGRKNPQGRAPISSVGSQGFEYVQGYEGTYRSKGIRKEQQETITAITLLQVINLLRQLTMKQDLKALAEVVKTQVVYCLQHLKKTKAELQKQRLKQLTQQF